MSAQPALYFIHADHLNTPRLVADAAGTTVWKWDQQEPFADNVADENPSGLGAFDLPLRLPGQRYDQETGLHYNYFRDYDPSLGRYGESDPIGLRAGNNTYAYGNGNPMRFTDPNGQLVFLLPLAVIGTEALIDVAVAAVGVTAGAIIANSIHNDSSDLKDEQCRPAADPCKGLRAQLAAHEKKLQEYIANPYGNDNRNLLGQGRDEQVIQGRIRNLQRQIENFRKLLAECERQNAQK